MVADPELAYRLVAFFAPIFAIWIVVGLTIAVLYTISLYKFDRDFRTRGFQTLDLLIGILRGFALVIAWPWVFFFDRSALGRIKLLLLSLIPGQSRENEDIKDAVREGEYWAWVRRSFVEEERLGRRRRHELETGEEQKRLLRVVHEGNPELERIWMLTGVGSNPGGVRQMVRLYPSYHIAEEILAGAKREVALRRPWHCLRCGAETAVDEIALPELMFLRILDWRTDKTLIEGWALQGEYRMKLRCCAKCGAAQPDLTEEVCRFGKASDTARLAREGLSLHWDLP